jgi:pilus assembly protein CpaF
MSFDVILPFLRPIAHLIQDPDVSEIMINGSRRIFIERQGLIEAIDGIEIDERNLKVAVKNIARALGDDVSEEKPILDSRLPDGSRVAAVFPPCSVGGTTLTIRKFQTRFFTAEELVRIGTMTPEVLDAVRTAIEKNENILISGGTSTGKTTLLNALAAFLPANDRIVLIEDTAELQIDRPNLVRFEARREQAGLPAVTIRELLRATLRHRPDRIIVGEVRGGEAYDLLQALNTGHAGTLSTIHANSAEQALARFSSCVVQSGIELPYQAVRYQIADAIHLVLHLGRHEGRRLVRELIRIGRYDVDHDRYEIDELIEGTGLRGTTMHGPAGQRRRNQEADGGVRRSVAVGQARSQSCGRVREDHPPRVPLSTGSVHASPADRSCCADRGHGRTPARKAEPRPIADTISLVLHLDRRQGVRCASELLRIRRYAVAEDHYETDELLRRRATREQCPD